MLMLLEVRQEPRASGAPEVGRIAQEVWHMPQVKKVQGGSSAYGGGAR